MGPELIIYWQDNQHKQVAQKYYLPAGESVQQSVARANALRSAAMQLSNAVIVRADLVYYDVVSPIGVAAVNSNTAINLIMLFRGLNNIGSIRIPSPRPDLPYDVTGPWQGLRISRELFAQQGTLAALEAAISNTIFQWGEPFPAQFTVAGIDYTI